ncbi:hypothetical protein CRM22_010321 [Opisthorchis felineus]|uniref:Alpha-carbonic anhydrase domain-containing protein n=1 Tax=Opisthorchis felineus TaxID=147828 RepID=A0A4S2L113_OPIFE|nr:hypothetical protein CRM22_010321 [Opisthorchis felineus]
MSNACFLYSMRTMEFRNIICWTLCLLVPQFSASNSHDGKFPSWDTENPAQDWETGWSYKSGEVGGPETWGTILSATTNKPVWPLCQIGHQQSPIDIQTERLLFDHTLKTFRITGSDEQLEFIVQNVGQDLQLSFLSNQVFLTGGPLSYYYQIFSARIKFGSASSKGSDHRIDGRSSPGELQIFAYNNELYKNSSQASNHPNGLAAVSVFFKLGNTSNKDLVGIVAAAEKTIFKGETFQLRGVEMRSLLSSTKEFITYQGSLPFPGCYETVTWIILNHPILISPAETLDCTMRKHVSYIANLSGT